MTRYHVSEDGMPRLCKAAVGSCPVSGPDGDKAAHGDFSNAQEAQRFAEQINSSAFGGSFKDTTLESLSAQYDALAAAPKTTKGWTPEWKALKTATRDYLQSIDLPEGYSVKTTFQGSNPSSQDTTLIKGERGEDIYFSPKNNGEWRTSAPGMNEGPFATLGEAVESAQQFEAPEGNKAWRRKEEKRKVQPPIGWDEMGSSARDMWIERHGWPDTKVEVFAHTLERGDCIYSESKEGKIARIVKTTGSGYHVTLEDGEVWYIPRNGIVTANKSK